MKHLSRRQRLFVLTAIVAAGALLRILPALPGWIAGAERCFSRPDTPGYLEVARALAAGDIFGGGTARPPGFPLVGAVCFAGFGDGAAGMLLLSVLMVLISSLLPLLVYRAAREYAGVTVGMVAAGLTAFNLTASANAPMLLSDTLFSLTTVLQLWFFLRMVKRGGWGWFVASAAVAAIGALIRPINSVWILPALVVLAATPRLSLRGKIAAAIAGTAIFVALPAPWMWRNASLGAGYTLDTNTGAMYHQNGAMLLAAVNHSDFESEKLRIREELAAEFADHERYPDEKSREAYRIRKFRELIAAHFFTWLPQHFTWKILLPDAPTFLENLGLTSSGRGTMGVLARDGLFAAVDHYFGGRWYLLLPLLPLVVITLLTVAGAAGRVVIDICRLRSRWFELLLFLAFVEYYLFLPGPITAPRYQLPALPFGATLAALFIIRVVQLLKRRANRCRVKS